MFHELKGTSKIIKDFLNKALIYYWSYQGKIYIYEEDYQSNKVKLETIT